MHNSYLGGPEKGREQEGNSLGDLRLWEGQVAPSVQMAGI